MRSTRHLQALKMVQLTKEKRMFVVRTYFETHSFVEGQQLFRERFPVREPAVKKAIWANVRRYKQHGTTPTKTCQGCGKDGEFVYWYGWRTY